MGAQKEAEESPEQISKYRKSFAENGLLLVGLLGGFTLATLALVVSNQATFAPRSFNQPSGLHLANGQSISFAEGYLFLLETLLGIVSLWSIAVSFAMLFIASSAHPERLTSQYRFVSVSVRLLTGSFAGVIGLLVFPFSPTSTLVIIIGAALITLILLRANHEDNERYQRAEGIKAPKTTSSAADTTADTERQ